LADLDGEQEPEGSVFEITPALRFKTEFVGSTLEISEWQGGLVGSFDVTLIEELIVTTTREHGLFVGQQIEITIGGMEPIRTSVRAISPNNYTFVANTKIGTRRGRGGTVRLLVEGSGLQVNNMIEFFGKEFDLQTFQTQWIDLFRTRRHLRAKLREIDYDAGDTILSARGTLPNDLTPNQSYLITKAHINLIGEETEIEALSL